MDDIRVKGAGTVKGEQVIEPLLYIDQPMFQKPKAYMQDHYQAVKSVLEEKTKEVPKQQKNADTSFKNLSIPEKVKYLASLPSEVPRIRCEVATKEDKYRGIMVKENEKEIEFRILGNEHVTIKKSEIIAIQLLGF